VEYLLKGGHKRIAFVETGHSVRIIEDRFQGYKKAMEAHGQEVSKDLIYHMNSTSLEFIHQSDGNYAVQLVKKICRAKPKITAVFATADIVAIEIIRAAKELGLRIPEDLSVIGFDDIQMAELMDPPLTTVWQPKYEWGRFPSSF
jgi:LacI family transcriptional regulator